VRNLRRDLAKAHLGHFMGPRGRVLQRTGSTPRQAVMFPALPIPEPPTCLHLEPASLSLRV
jgi:hypothetical protein